MRRWVSYHGLAINVEPDLSHFDGIAGPQHGVTSPPALGIAASMAEVDVVLRKSFDEVFGG